MALLIEIFCSFQEKFVYLPSKIQCLTQNNNEITLLL